MGIQRHQKQALTFMVRREKGWDLKSNGDIWTTDESQQGCCGSLAPSTLAEQLLT